MEFGLVLLQPLTNLANILFFACAFLRMRHAPETDYSAVTGRSVTHAETNGCAAHDSTAVIVSFQRRRPIFRNLYKRHKEQKTDKKKKATLEKK